MKKVIQTTLIENFEKAEFLKWLVGFVEGEGCFTFEYNQTTKVHKRGYCIHPLFQIGLSIKDKDIIYKIQRELGMGRIYYKTQKTLSGRTTHGIAVRISKVNEIKRLIDLFDKCKFYTIKKYDYELWKEGVRIIDFKRHLTKDGLKELLSIRKQMNIRVGKKCLKE